MDPRDWAAGYDGSDEVDSLATEDCPNPCDSDSFPLLLLGMRLACPRPCQLSVAGRSQRHDMFYWPCGQHGNQVNSQAKTAASEILLRKHAQKLTLIKVSPFGA